MSKNDKKKVDDDDDMGAMYRAMKQAHANKREENRDNSATLLIKYGIAFDTCNFGAHLMIKLGGKNTTNSIIDFWPGTGRWVVRDKDTRGFGVFGLLAVLNINTDTEEAI